MKYDTCPNCGYEKYPEDDKYTYCSDCRKEIESDDDWFR